MLTLHEFSDRFVTPWVLSYVGLPDTPEGRETLDALVGVLLSNDAEQEPGG